MNAYIIRNRYILGKRGPTQHFTSCILNALKPVCGQLGDIGSERKISKCANNTIEEGRSNAVTKICISIVSHKCTWLRIYRSLDIFMKIVPCKTVLGINE